MISSQYINFIIIEGFPEGFAITGAFLIAGFHLIKVPLLHNPPQKTKDGEYKPQK